MKQSFIKLNINQDKTIFSNEDIKIVIPIGYELIANKYFKNTPPSYSEIEYAINYIEDEIEKVVSSLKNDEFISNDIFIKELAKVCNKSDIKKDILKTDDLESLFGDYAEVSMGRVARFYQDDLSGVFYAKLLILREYMHHLKMEHLKLID